MFCFEFRPFHVLLTCYYYSIGSSQGKHSLFVLLRVTCYFVCTIGVSSVTISRTPRKKTCPLSATVLKVFTILFMVSLVVLGIWETSLSLVSRYSTFTDFAIRGTKLTVLQVSTLSSGCIIATSTECCLFGLLLTPANGSSLVMDVMARLLSLRTQMSMRIPVRIYSANTPFDANGDLKLSHHSGNPKPPLGSLLKSLPLARLDTTTQILRG